MTFINEVLLRDQIMKKMNIQQVMLSALLWALVTNQLYVTGGSIFIHTPQQVYPYTYTKLSSHGYKVRNSTCFVFEYKGCSEATIALMEEDGNIEGKMCEVIIGGWRNTQSVIRPRMGSRDYKTTKVLHGVLHCNESRKFKVEWKDGDITVYRWSTCTWEVLMSWHSTWYTVNYIGVTSGVNANGDWIIYNEECHISINRNTLWTNDISRKDTEFSAPMFTKSDIDSSIRCAMQCQRHNDCRYYTYNGKQRDCKGFSDIGTTTASEGTQLWIRY